MRPDYNPLVEDLRNILNEEEPDDKHVADTLNHMSKLAAQQVSTAHDLGTPSAFKMAAQTNTRVAKAAAIHGWDEMADVHNKHIKKMHKQAEKAGKRERAAKKNVPGQAVHRAAVDALDKDSPNPATHKDPNDPHKAKEDPTTSKSSGKKKKADTAGDQRAPTSVKSIAKAVHKKHGNIRAKEPVAKVSLASRGRKKKAAKKGSGGKKSMQMVPGGSAASAL